MLILAFLPFAGLAAQDTLVEEQSALRSWPEMPSIGDVDGDGVSDLIHEREHVLSVVSGGDPTVKLRSISITNLYPEGAGPTWEVGPDVDGDGVRDLAVLNGFALVSSIFIDVVSGRTGESLARTEKELPGHTTSIAWTDDVDGDGLEDVVITGGLTQLYSSKSLAPLWSVRPTGSRSGKPAASSSKIAARLQVALAEDLDGDGIRDVAVGVKPEQGHTISRR